MHGTQCTAFISSHAGLILVKSRNVSSYLVGKCPINIYWKNDGMGCPRRLYLQYISSLSSSTSVQYANPLSLSPTWLTRTVFFLTGLLAPTPASVQSIPHIEARVIFKKWNHGDFPGGPVAKTARSMQRAQVRSQVRELEPSCCNQEFTCWNYRSHIF